MAITLIVYILVTAASAAPPISDGAYMDWQKDFSDRMELSKLQQAYPAKRSNYAYVSPCAAAASAPMSYTSGMAASAPIPGYASAAAATPYAAYSHAAYQTAPANHGYASPHYGHPYYRMEDERENEQEVLGFSDMDHVALDHVPMARYSYAAAPMVPIAGGSTSSGQAASGPVVGVFSNANVGGCSVPLLVSCSPSIAHGHIVKSQPYYANTASPAQLSNSYRVVDEEPQHEETKGHQETAAQSSEHTAHNSKAKGDEHQ